MPGSSPASRYAATASSSSMPNLFSLRPVEILAWVCASTSGLTRIAIRRDPASRAGDFAQTAQLRHRLDVDLMNAGSERRRHLGRRLADPGKDDPLGRHAGGERAAQLPLGDDVGARAEAGEVTQHGEVRVGLDRVADQRPLGQERVGKAPVLRGETGRRVEIERGADRRRDVRDRHLFGVAARRRDSGKSHSLG